jgi:hypothetical protein
MATGAEVEQAASILRELLSRVESGDLEAPGRRGKAIIARLEGALLGLTTARDT